MRFRGFTLMEIIIYFSLSLAALGILVALVTVLRRTGDHTYAQYLVSGNMATTMRMIRKDLQATALASVTAYNGDAGYSGFSCVSAYDTQGQFSLGDYGAPHWQKHVYYLLKSDGKIRRATMEITNKNYLPTLAPAPTGSMEEKILMFDALAPNKAVGAWQPATPMGGLEVGFVRRKGATEAVSQVNPRDSAKADENTRLIEIGLRLFEEKSGPNFLEVKFRVAPRY